MALPPPFAPSHLIQLAATSSSLTTIEFIPPPSANANASSCESSFGEVNSPSEPSIPLISPLSLSLDNARKVTAEPGFEALASCAARARSSALLAPLNCSSALSRSPRSATSCFCNCVNFTANDSLSSTGFSSCRSSPVNSRSSRSRDTTSYCSSKSARLSEAILAACSALSDSSLASAILSCTLDSSSFANPKARFKSRECLSPDSIALRASASSLSASSRALSASITDCLAASISPTSCVIAASADSKSDWKNSISPTASSEARFWSPILSRLVSTSISKARISSITALDSPVAISSSSRETLTNSSSNSKRRDSLVLTLSRTLLLFS